MPVLAASAGWSTSWKKVMPFAAMSGFRRATISSSVYALLTRTTPLSPLGRPLRGTTRRRCRRRRARRRGAKDAGHGDLQ